jgi:hypothetical protein
VSVNCRIAIPLAILRLALASFDELVRLTIACPPLPRPPPASISLRPLARAPEPRCELSAEGFAGSATEGGASPGSAQVRAARPLDSPLGTGRRGLRDGGQREIHGDSGKGVAGSTTEGVAGSATEGCARSMARAARDPWRERHRLCDGW